MESVSLLLIVAIVFVLWLAVVALSTGGFRVKRPLHRNHIHLGRQR
jgi:hypothetical protein